MKTRGPPPLCAPGWLSPGGPAALPFSPWSGRWEPAACGSWSLAAAAAQPPSTNASTSLTHGEDEEASERGDWGGGEARGFTRRSWIARGGTVSHFNRAATLVLAPLV